MAVIPSGVSKVLSIPLHSQDSESISMDGTFSRHIVKYVQSIGSGSLCSLPSQGRELIEDYDNGTDRIAKEASIDGVLT